MSDLQSSEPVGMFTIGKLPRESWDSAQEFAEDIASRLVGIPATSIGGAQVGSRITLETREIAIPSGATFVTAPFDASSCIINVINRISDSGTLRVTTINGNRVNLSGAAPDGNYVLSVTRISVL